MMRKLILGLGIAVILTSCSSTKNINTIAVPKGNQVAVTIPAKKGVWWRRERIKGDRDGELHLLQDRQRRYSQCKGLRR